MIILLVRPSIETRLLYGRRNDLVSQKSTLCKTPLSTQVLSISFYPIQNFPFYDEIYVS